MYHVKLFSNLATCNNYISFLITLVIFFLQEWRWRNIGHQKKHQEIPRSWNPKVYAQYTRGKALITIHKKLEVYWGIIIFRGGGAIFVAFVDNYSHCTQIYELNPHESIYMYKHSTNKITHPQACKILTTHERWPPRKST